MGNNLAYAYESAALGRAIPPLEQILADSARVLGADHLRPRPCAPNLAAARQHNRTRPEEQSDAGGEPKSSAFVLLNDLPVSDPRGDLLGMKGTAEGIAEMLMSSRAASPFVVAVDAGWGMGKSTLLRQVQTSLEAQDGDARVTTVWFNAWTAEGGNALEELIKSVLEELDSNIVRRRAGAASWPARRRPVHGRVHR